MGLGCNAAGVTGCRIIDSPRERMIAVLTNSFLPCNGRFPTLLVLLAAFFGAGATAGGGALSALLLTAAVLVGVLATLGASWLLSKTVLKGAPSSFTLELPPFRKPQIGRVIVRSLLDRTLFVLGRAAAVAAPAGLVIYLLANLWAGERTLLMHVTNFLDPFARLFGLDGVLLTSFVLGLPANEIVLPIALMAYASGGTMAGGMGIAGMRALLLQNGWTVGTCVCTLVFLLLHWPCSTTLWTVRKETGSTKWMLAAAALPTAAGLIVCAAVNLLFRLLG